MIVRGIAAATGILIRISAVAIMGASLAPSWAGAETARPAPMFGSNGALDASSLGNIHTGLAAAPGRGEGEEVRRKRPNPSDVDPLKANREGNPLPSQSGLSSPFTANLTLNGSPLTQPPPQNPPPATSNPPLASNPPPATTNPPVASNPPPVQNTAPVVSNPTLAGVITSIGTIGTSATTVLRRVGLAQ